MTSRKKILHVLVIATIGLAPPLVASAQTSTSSSARKPAVKMTPTQVFAKARPSVFTVEFWREGFGPNPLFISIAVALGPNELVAVPSINQVNWVLKGEETIRLRQGKRTWPASLTKFDSDRGFCWLKVEGLNARPVALRNSSTLKSGERIYSVSTQRSRWSNGDVELSELGEAVGTFESLTHLGRQKVIKASNGVIRIPEIGALFDSDGRLIGLGEGFAFVAEGGSVYAAPAELVNESKEAAFAPLGVGSFDFNECPSWHAAIWNDIALGASIAKDFEGAAASYNRAIRCAPREAGLFYSLCFMRRMLNDREGTVGACLEAVRLDPNLADAWSLLGDIYSADGDYTRAVESYEKVVKQKPKDFRTWTKLGVTYEKLGQPEKTALALEQASRWESDPENDDAPFYQALVKAQPQNSVYWAELGNIHARMKRPSEAVRAYRESIRWNPLNAQVWFDLGQVYSKLKDLEHAAEAFDKAAQLDPMDPWKWASLAGAFKELKKWRLAAEAYQHAVKLHPQSGFLWFELGRVYCMQGNTQGVMEIYDLVRDPSAALIGGSDLAQWYFRDVVQKSAQNCQDEPKLKR